MLEKGKVFFSDVYILYSFQVSIIKISHFKHIVTDLFNQ